MVVPHWWFQAFKVSVFSFFQLSLLVQDCYILCRIFPEVLTIFQIPLSPRFKVSNLFQAPSSKIRSSHLYYTSNLFILFIQFKPVVPVVPVILVTQVTLVMHSCHSSCPGHLSCSSHLCYPSQKYGKIYGVIRAQNITFRVLTKSWGNSKNDSKGEVDAWK